MAKQGEKTEKTTEAKVTANKPRVAEDKVVFAVSYNSDTRCAKIGNLAIPTWLLCILAGAFSVLLLQALFSK